MSKTIFDMELEAMSTEELKAILKKALAQSPKDYEWIYKILEVLQKRKTKPQQKPPFPVTQEEVDEALLIWQEAKDIPQPETKPLWRRKSASVVAAILCVLLIAVPIVSGLPFVQQMLATWNEDYFWIETPGTPVAPPEGYVFQTDNPGLQQLYNAVTELGITQPVVPMWLPEELDDFLMDTVLTEDEVKISSFFHSDDEELIILLERKENMESEMCKNESDPEIWLLMDREHFCISNNNMSKVVWQIDEYEITIMGSIDNTLMYSIVNSVYQGRG